MDVIKHKQIKPITMMLSGGISGIGYLNDSDNTIYVTTTYVSGGATPPPGSAGFLVTVVNHDCYPYGENKGSVNYHIHGLVLQVTIPIRIMMLHNSPYTAPT
jgi:hypothetical protein